MQNICDLKTAQEKRSISPSIPSRLWFMARGCKQVPPDFIGGKILWAHPDGYFLNAQGQKLAHSFGPGMQVSKPNMHAAYPTMRCFGNKNCHILMAFTFYHPRPIFTDKNGKPYVGICHHLIPDKLNYRPANLLCWLTRPEHGEADRRQRALRKVLTDLSVLGYNHLRKLQDPRAMSRETFNVELQKLTDIYAKENIS